MGMFTPRLEERTVDPEDVFFGEAGTRTAAGRRVSASTATRVITVLRCVKLLADVISTLPKDVVVSLGGNRFVEFTKPSWITSPTPADRSITDVEHFSQVVGAMALAGDSFTYVPNGIHPLDGIEEPAVLEVLAPTHVRCKPGPLYEILDDRGRVRTTVGTDRMLHVSWYRPAGALRGLNPIDEARQAIGLALGTEEFAARFFGQGATMALGVEVPGALTETQRLDLVAGLEGLYSGTKKAHRIGVVTGGAKFVSGLGVTNDQAQFLESRKFSKEDIATLFGVPPHLVGSQEPGASSYNSVEQRSLEFGKFNIAPWVSRIMAQYSRLAAVPQRLATTDATAHFQMDLRGLERADIKTRFEAYGIGLDKGIFDIDTVLSLEDMPPIGEQSGGRIHRSQLQMVGVETADMAARVNSVGALIRAGYDPASAAQAVGLPPIKHSGLVPVTVQGEDVATATA